MHWARGVTTLEKAESAYKHTNGVAPRGFNCSIQLLLTDDTVWSEHRCTKLYSDMHPNGLSGGDGDVRR